MKMKSVLQAGMIVLVGAMVYWGGTVYAQSLEYDVTKGEYRRKDNERTYLVGKIVSISDVLQHRAGGADAQDALFSKGRQGIVTSGGTVWTIVDNIKGQDLQWNKEYLGKFVKVHGWVFHDAQYVEIDSFAIDGKEYAWSDKTSNFELVSQSK